MRNRRSFWAGLGLAAGAFIMWGVLPLYWAALREHSAIELLIHRVLWSLVFTALALTCRREWGEVRGILRDRSSALKLAVSALLIGSNWLVFILAVRSGRVLECSLGYFIMPLAGLIFGAAVLRERLKAWQKASALLMVIAIAYSVAGYGRVPLIALFLAVTFAGYGLLHKITPVRPLPAFFFETMLLALPALGGLAAWRGDLNWSGLPLLATTGLTTSIPMLLYTAAAARLGVSELGVLQYVNPTIQFLMATLILHETLRGQDLLVFGLIWVSVVIFWSDRVDGAVRVPSAELGGEDLVHQEIRAR